MPVLWRHLMIANLEVAKLQPLGGWRGRYREVVTGEPALAVTVDSGTTGEWRFRYDSGDVVTYDGAWRSLIDGGRATSLPSQGLQLLLPFGLEPLAAPDLATVERLVQGAVSREEGSRNGRRVYILVDRVGGRYILDATMRFGHELVHESVQADLSDLSFTPPPDDSFSPAIASNSQTLGLGRVAVTLAEDGVAQLSRAPVRELYVKHHLWALQDGPAGLVVEAALGWCEQYAEATVVDVTERGVRHKYGRGEWRGEVLRPIPSYLLGH